MKNGNAPTYRVKRAREIIERGRLTQMLDIDQTLTQIVRREISVAQISIVDEFFSALKLDAEAHIDAGLISKATEYWTWGKLTSLRAALRKIFERSPFERELDIAIARWHGPPEDRHRSHKPREKRFSLDISDLPHSWLEALAAMEDGLPGVAANPPAPSMIATTKVKLREFAKVARDRGLAMDLTLEATREYEKSLFNRERPLSPVTIHSAMRQVRDFGRYIGAKEEVLDYLLERVRFHERRSAKIQPKKEAKVLSLPTYSEMFAIAFEMLGEADRLPNPRHAQYRRNAALAITLFAALPLRVADTRISFGKELAWDEAGYKFDLKVSKTGRRFQSRIHPVFAFFIDQVVLQGCAPIYLSEMRESCFQKRRLLFVNYDDTAPHKNYVSFLWSQVLGTGSHAARTKLHDEFARFGSRGVELAMKACGHRSERTAEAYRTAAFERLALEKVHDDLSCNFSDDEWREFFQ